MNAAYTQRADEVMTGGSNFNQTEISAGSQAGRHNASRPETFEHYVSPIRNNINTNNNANINTNRK